MNKLRPRISLGKNKTQSVIIYLLLIITTISLVYGQLKDIIILDLLGLPCIYIYYLIAKKIYICITTKIEITDTEIKVINKDKYTDIKLLDQENESIKFSNIEYVYFAEKEMKNILYIKNKIKKYKIIHNESNYSPKNLIEKHKIPKGEIAKIMETKGIVFDENNVLDFIDLIEEMKEKYDISNYKIQDIERDIKNKLSITFEHISNIFAEDNIKKKDTLRIKKYFTQNEHGILLPFTKTKIDVDNYEKYSENIFETKEQIDWTLVLSDSTGEHKLYIPHFFNYNIKSRQKILEKIKWKTNAQILFTKELFKQHNLMSED